MAIAPKAIWNLWYAIEAAYNGPGLQDEELAGIVGDRLHSFGFHLAPDELSSSDYSLQTARDRDGARSYPGDASALDVHFGPTGMVLVTHRLIAAAEARDPRMNCLYEFCGTTNGSTPHPYTVDTHTNDVNNTQGWDDSHVTHVHLSIHRDVSNNFQAIQGLAEIIAGDDMSAADVAAINAHTDAKIEAVLHQLRVDGVRVAYLNGGDNNDKDPAHQDAHNPERLFQGIPGYKTITDREAGA